MACSDVEGTVILVAKLPCKGRSKTRLVPALGEDATLALATAMLSDMLSRLAAAPALRATRKVLLFAPAAEAAEAARFLAERGLSEAWLARPMLDARQSLTDSDLGAKLAAALEEEQSAQAAEAQVAPSGLESGSSHAAARPIAFIGMDSPTLPDEAIATALREAGGAGGGPGAAHVCGAADGGYTLLALPPRTPTEVFTGVSWSCERTLDSQVERLEECGLAVSRGATYADIDEVADVKALAQQVGAEPSVARLCPAVSQVLSTLSKQLSGLSD